MGLADRDYMRNRNRGLAQTPRFTPKLPDSPAPNWPAAILVVLLIAAASWAGYRLLAAKGSIPFPLTGQVSWYVPPSGPDELAPLTIAAPPRADRNYAVILREKQTRRMVALVPIRAGETAKVDVPLGEYELSIASGKAWHGPEKLFGMAGELKQAVEPMLFYRSGDQRMGHRIDLAERINGNLKTKPVGPFGS